MVLKLSDLLETLIDHKHSQFWVAYMIQYLDNVGNPDFLPNLVCTNFR